MTEVMEVHGRFDDASRRDGSYLECVVGPREHRYGNLLVPWGVGVGPRTPASTGLTAHRELLDAELGTWFVPSSSHHIYYISGFSAEGLIMFRFKTGVTGSWN